MLSITFIIIALTVLVSYQGFSNMAIYEKLLFDPWKVKHNKEYYRLLSHILLHADWSHLAVNMIVFYSFGSFLEQVFTSPGLFRDFFPLFNFWGIQTGYLLFIGLYIFGALGASIPAMIKKADTYGYRAVGASGAVSALMMVFMILFPQFEVVFFFIIPLPAYIAAPVFFIMEHYLQKRGQTNVAHDAHIWGAISGIIFILLINPSFLTHFVNTVRAIIF
jgi:membrane associated rhomboid family serine protease